MKTKRLILSVIVIVGFLFVFASASSAFDWVHCTVIKTGPGISSVYVRLSDNSDPTWEKWCVADPKFQDRVLATALTAMTSNKGVHVGLDDVSATTPTITCIYVEEMQ